MSLRIDKFVWAVRLAKTRSLASDLVAKGKVKLNGEQVKPAKSIKVKDEIHVIKNTAVFKYKVIDLLEKRVGAKLVPNYIIDITEPEEIEKYKQYQVAQRTYRNYGTGKPSKKDRREIDDFLDNWSGDE